MRSRSNRADAVSARAKDVHEPPESRFPAAADRGEDVRMAWRDYHKTGRAETNLEKHESCYHTSALRTSFALTRFSLFFGFFVCESLFLPT